MEALVDHCNSRSNKSGAATAYKQLVQGDLGLPEYIQKSEEITAACNFEAAYYKYLWNAIFLGLPNQNVHENCFEVGNKLTTTEVIHIETEVCNLDRQLSIMQSLSPTITATTEVQNPSVSELHLVKARHNNKGPVTEDRNSGNPARISVNPVVAMKYHYLTQRRTAKPRMLNNTSVVRNTSRVAASPRREKRT